MKTLTTTLLLLSSLTLLTMAQTNSNDAQRWLDNARQPPSLKSPETKREWQDTRLKIRADLSKLLGDLPSRPAVPKVKILSLEDKHTYTLEKFEFDNGAGATVPGYFVLPKGAKGKVPAILYCHWHGGEYEIGKDEIFQARHTPARPAETFAQMGFAVMAIDAYCFGERNGRGPGGEKGQAGELSASKFQLWVGRSLWGMMLHDDLMALDYLVSRKEIDPKRIGAMGMSMGATRTWWMMALDERIKVGVPVACLTRYEDLVQQNLLKAHGIYYYVPGLFARYDMESVVALIAPRPVLFLDGDKDSTAPVSGIRKIDAAVRPIYRLYDKEQHFENIIYSDQGHLYTPEMWHRTLSWFQEHLCDR